MITYTNFETKEKKSTDCLIIDKLWSKETHMANPKKKLGARSSKSSLI